MKTLKEIFDVIGNHSGKDLGGNDKGSTHSYLETYEELFKPFQGGCSFLEIGLATGDSIKLFDQYFENSTIIGMDISVVFTPGEYKNNVNILQGDATDINHLGQLGYQTFDIIIDDGSHMSQDQVKTFNLLKSRMNPGGLYIIEDILDLDQVRNEFIALHGNCKILDLRHVKNRFDDVLIIYKF